MYLKLNNNLTKEEFLNVVMEIEKLKFNVKNYSTREEKILFVNCNEKDVEILNNVNHILSIQKEYLPFKNTAKFNEPVEIKFNDFVINDKTFTIIAGPCSVESVDQMNSIVNDIEENIHILRGGAFKPRTSPYGFQGLKNDGVEILKKVCKNKPIVSEIVSIEDISYFEKNVDIIQVGARNMQNFDLLKKLGKINKPVLLKRGFSNTIEEWLQSAEYIMESGNKKVILCERGIRTFENFTRNTLDLSAVVAVKEISCLPVFVDPSHAAGKYWMVEKLAKAALACGADGIMIEVHNDPCNALTDGPQSIKPKDFNEIIKDIKKVAPYFNKLVM